MRSFSAAFLEHSRISISRAIDGSGSASDMMHHPADHGVRLWRTSQARLTAQLDGCSGLDVHPVLELGPDGQWTASPPEAIACATASGIADGTAPQP